MTLSELKAMYAEAKDAREDMLAHGLTVQSAEAEQMMADIKRQYQAQKRKNQARRDRDDVMRSCGLVRVVGNQGGVYWE